MNLAKVMDRIEAPDTNSRRHLNVFFNGVRDAVEKCHVNPYPDIRCGPHDNIVTGARGYRNYWQRGHEADVAFIANNGSDCK